MAEDTIDVAATLGRRAAQRTNVVRLQRMADQGFGPSASQISNAQQQAMAMQQQAMGQSTQLATRFGSNLTPETAALLRARTAGVPAQFMGQFFGEASRDEQARRMQFMQQLLGISQQQQAQRAENRTGLFSTIGSIAGMGLQFGGQQSQMGQLQSMFGGQQGQQQMTPFGVGGAQGPGGSGFGGMSMNPNPGMPLGLAMPSMGGAASPMPTLF